MTCVECGTPLPARDGRPAALVCSACLARRRPLTPAQERARAARSARDDQIARAYLDGRSVAQIARDFELGRSTVEGILRRRGA